MTERIGKAAPKDYRYSFFTEAAGAKKEQPLKPRRTKKGLKRLKRELYRHSLNRDPTAFSHRKKGGMGVRRRSRQFYRHSQNQHPTVFSGRNGHGKEVPLSHEGHDTPGTERLGSRRRSRVQRLGSLPVSPPSPETVEFEKSFHHEAKLDHHIDLWKDASLREDKPVNATLVKRLRELFPLRKKAVKPELMLPGGNSYGDRPHGTVVVALLLFFVLAAFCLTFLIQLTGYYDTTMTSLSSDVGGTYLVTHDKTKSSTTGATTPPSVVTYACIYHAKAKGQRLGSVDYSLALFPFDYCHLAVYCCASLNAELLPVPPEHESDQTDRFITRTKLNQALPAKLAIGSGSEDQLVYKTLLENHKKRDSFIKAIAPWCVLRGFSGIFINWPSSVTPWSRLADFYHQLQGAFETHGLTAGAMLPQSYSVLTEQDWYHLTAITRHASILLKPPVYTVANYTGKTFRYILLFLL